MMGCLVWPVFVWFVCGCSLVFMLSGSGLLAL